MADVEFDAFEGDGAEYSHSDPGMASALVNWTGAVLSVGLIAGLAVWGYKLTIRDVTDIPVIRALEGPMRIQPDDPGGTQAAHQGLAVNQVQAEGEVEAPADRIVLAPQPIDLFSAPEPTPDAPAPQAELGANAPQAIAEETVTDRSAMAEGVEAALALAEDVTQNVAPLAEATVAAEPLPEPLPEVKSHLTKIVPLSVPGVKRTSLPIPRPAGGYEQAVVVQEEARAVAATATVDLDPATLTQGMRLVQLGAYDSPQIARAEWDGFAARFSTYMENKQRVIQEAKSGGRTFYRLRVAGFDGLSDARRFCTVVLADGGACIPVTHR